MKEFKRQLAWEDVLYFRKVREDERKVVEFSGRTKLPIANDLAKAVGISGNAAVRHLQNLGLRDAELCSEVPWEFAVKLHRRINGQDEPSEAVSALYLKGGVD